MIINTTPLPTVGTMGWICPKCSRGVAPTQQNCNCTLPVINPMPFSTPHVFGPSIGPAIGPIITGVTGPATVTCEAVPTVTPPGYAGLNSKLSYPPNCRCAGKPDGCQIYQCPRKARFKHIPLEEDLKNV